MMISYALRVKKGVLARNTGVVSFLLICLLCLPAKMYGNAREGESALHYDLGMVDSNLPPSPSLNLTETMTLEAWIKPDGWGEGPNYLATIFHKPSIWLFIIYEHGTANDRSLILQLRHDGVISRTYSELGSIVLNEWSHIAVTYNSNENEVQMIINGVLQDVGHISEPSGPIRYNASEGFQVGSVSGSTMGFMGVLDEVRIWNDSRSQAEITQSMGAPLTGEEPGLRLYWPMNEGGGDSLHDISGNGHDIRISGMEWTYGTPFHPTSIEMSRLPQIIPAKAILHANYPNPFNPETTIDFTIANPGKVALTVFDLKGNRVAQLANGYHAAGDHQVLFNGGELSSGTYLYVLEKAFQREVKRMVYLK